MEHSGLELNREQISQIAEDTVGQSHNQYWHKVRKNRLTASQFGKAIRAYEYGRESSVNEVISVIKGEKTVPPVPAIKWGRDHEIVAIQHYMELTGYCVKPTGLWIFPNGYLAASPDGLVFETDESQTPSGIIEIKCPYSVRFMNFAEMTYQNKLPLYLNASGNLKLSADYYHQIQGELYATGAPWCDFVVWTTKDLKIQRIYPSQEWHATKLPKLISFYIENILSLHLQLLTLKGILYLLCIKNILIASGWIRTTSLILNRYTR